MPGPLDQWHRFVRTVNEYCIAAKGCQWVRMHHSGWITDRRRYGSSMVGNRFLGAVPDQIGFGYWMSQGEGVEPREMWLFTDRGVYNCAVAATEPSINGLCSRVCHAGARLPSVTIRSGPPPMRSALSVLRKPTTSGASTQRVI